jgi:ankyrin repeat protein
MKQILLAVLAISSLLHTNTALAVNSSPGLFFEYAKRGNLDAIRELADDGADLSITNDKGQNALHLAAWNNHYFLVEFCSRKA